MSSMTIDGRIQFANPRSAVRLTRRGRLVLFVLALMVIVGAGIVWAAGSVATESPERTETITVVTGQTLWGIASDLTDDGHVRPMIDHIKTLNDLDSGTLAAGQSLLVPVE